MTFSGARVLCLAMTFAGTASAAERLTIERALETAEQIHPQVRAAIAQMEGARQGITTAKAYPNPQLDLIAGPQRVRLKGAVPGADQVLTFLQPLETHAVRSTRIEGAELRRASAGYSLEETRLSLRAAVRQAFYEALRRRAQVELSRESERLVEELGRRIRVQVEVGESARFELVRAEAELAVARASAESAQLRLVTALATLRSTIGMPQDVEIELEGNLRPVPPLPALEMLRRDMNENHPALRLVQSESRRADARLRNEMAQRTPQPSFRSEYEHQPDLATLRVGLSITLPAWNRRQGPIGEAAAAVRQANSEADLRRLELNAALESAYGRYQVANRQIAVYEDGVLRQAEAALRAAEAAFRFGERGVMEVLDAQRVLRGARLEFLNAQYDRESALIDLEQLRAADFRESAK